MSPEVVASERPAAANGRDASPVPVVALCMTRTGGRRWHGRLAERLRTLGAAPRVIWVEADEASPRGMDSLFALERTLSRRPGPRPSDRIAPDVLGLPGHGDATDAVRLVLPGVAESEPSGAVWRILFDGVPGEGALFCALLAGRAPLVEVVDDDGRVRARGLPSLEAAAGLCDAYEAVVARLVTLVVAAVRAPAQGAPEGRAPAAPRSLATYARKRASHALLRRIYHLCCFAPHWRTGWRFTRGPTVWESGSLDGEPWRVLTGPGERFFADPFPFRWQGRTHVFVEDFDHRVGRGVISAVSCDADGPRGPVAPVLEESFHLSYPFLLAHRGQVWMIPETSQNGTVTLYRADPFPERWVRECDLLTGITASDATVIQHDGRWWMFATVHDGEGAHSDTLCLFMADDLFGPWVPHPANPVLIDASCARPAGNMVVRDGRLWRPVQDCTRRYGGALALCEVTALTPTRFEQAVRVRLGPCAAWPGKRLHTLNDAGGIEVIDGSALSPRFFGRAIAAARAAR